MLEIHAVVDVVVNLSLGIVFDVEVERHANVVRVISRVISISRVTNEDAAASHFVKLGRRQLNKCAKVIHG